MENVYLVYLLRRTHADSPRDGIAFYLSTKLIANLLAELLGIVEHLVMIVRGQYDSGSIDTTGKASATSLVTTGLDNSFLIIW
jgi:hypothetical protein